MIVSHQSKFIFIKPKKVAGSSVELFLSAFCGPDDIITSLGTEEEKLRLGRTEQNWRLPRHRRNRLLRIVGAAIDHPTLGYAGYYQHMTAANARRMLGPEIWDSYFKFTIERNPWDRQVSLYHWHYRGRAKPPSFDSFIRNPLRRKISPNYDIYSIGGEVAVDFVCHYHRLEEDLATVLERLGLDGPVTLPRAKSGFRKEKKHWRDYYTPQTRDIVGRWYRREIETFGYRFDDEAARTLQAALKA